MENKNFQYYSGKFSLCLTNIKQLISMYFNSMFIKNRENYSIKHYYFC